MADEERAPAPEDTEDPKSEDPRRLRPLLQPGRATGHPAQRAERAVDRTPRERR